MNNVYLEGRVIQVEEKLHPTPEKHALLTLEITHRTQAGIIRREQYPVNAWRNLAAWALRSLRPGDQVLVSGYLTQRVLERQAYTEVTASRILPLQLLPHQAPSMPTVPLAPSVSPAPLKQPVPEGQPLQGEGR